MLFADSLVVSLIPPVIDNVSPSFLGAESLSSPWKDMPLLIASFELSATFLTSSSCPLFTASFSSVASATFVIFLFPASIPLFVILGPSFIVRPPLFITVSPTATLSRPVNSLAKATVKFPSSFL